MKFLLTTPLRRVARLKSKTNRAFQRPFPDELVKSMSRRAYSEINLPITWHTKNNLPLIKPEIESKLYQFLKQKMLETPEIFVHAIGGIENHVHIAVSVPPTVQPAEWIGRLKGSSAHFINQSATHKLMEWQNGYGIVSFGTKDLKWVIRYVLNQKEHHKTGKTFARLETVEKEDG
jgi:putative transposase